VLVERGEMTIAPEIVKLMGTASPLGRIHALRSLDGIKALAPEVLATALKDSDAKVRSLAVQLSGVVQVPQLLTMTNDSNAEVRLHLAAQLSQQQTPEAQSAIRTLLKKGGSPLLMDAVASGVRGREVEILEWSLQAKEGSADDLTSTGFAQMLANCVMNERRVANVTKLLNVCGELPANSKRLTSIVKGMAGMPLDTSKKFSPKPRKLLYLDAEPAALTKMRKQSSKDLSKLVGVIDASLAWPGKPGVPPPPKIIPLTAEQQTRFDQGKLLYMGLCGACHQPTGSGLDGLAPPLVDSDWVLGKAEVPAKIVLHGLSGEVRVSDRTYRLEMPPLGAALNDDQIANVLTYIRREWEHNASPITPADIAKVRAANSSRTKAWTSAELKGGK
jgi:mono/diheme cytochrome c family protein